MDAVKGTPGQRLARSIAAPQAGQIIGGRYQLEEWLESGAMGNVWRAQQVRLRSRAAIKFLDPSLIEVPEMLERFLQEARSAAAVQSAHVIQVFDYGSEGGLPYIAMELLHGENLEARLARRGVLSPAELDKIFSEVARGLGQAHAMGVIHRDVKPGNIFVVREGPHEVSKIIDFGIAKVKADALRVSQVVGTQLGAFLGTPQYMSPEQMRGLSTVDYRTDLWALAIIACECLVGRHPFSATTIGDLTVQICMEEPLAPSTLGDVPAGFDEWFFKGTRKAPSDRFESAGEMADALTSVLVPAERAPASDPRRAPLVPPSALAVSGGWSATSRRLERLWALAFERACAQGATSAARLRTTARGVSKTVAEALSRPIGSRSGVVGLALLVVTCSLLLIRAGRRPRPTTVAADSTSQAAVVSSVVLPVTPLPAVPAAPSAPPPDPVTPPALPVLAPEKLARSPVMAAKSTPSKARKARRRGKRHSPPGSSGRHAASIPSTPMSSAMMRLSEALAKGRNKQPEPATDAASGQARDRASSKTE